MLEGLVPYCLVECCRTEYGGNPDGISLYTFATHQKTSIGGLEKVLGIKSVSIDFDGNAAEVKIVIPLSEKHIFEADNASGPIFEALNLLNHWRIEYGWGGYGKKQSAKISDLRLLNFSLDYASDMRGYDLTLTLLPAFDMAIADINVGMCMATVTKIQNALISPSEQNEDLSLGGIISSFLIECKLVVDRIYKDNLPKPEYNIEDSPTISAIKGLYSSPVEQPQVEKDPYNPLSYNQDVANPPPVPLFRATDVLKTAHPADILAPEDITLIVLKSTWDECNKVAEAFHKDTIFEKDYLRQIVSDPKYMGETVLNVISRLLSDNGFTFFPMPGVIGQNGKMGWVISQSSFNNLGAYYEGEYSGIFPPIKKEEGSGYSFKNKKIVNTILFGSKDEGFDLLSSRNVIQSIDATTDNGKATLASATAAMVFAGKGTDDKSEIYGKTLYNHTISMYQLLVEQAKTVDMTVLGMAILKPFDNIYLTMAGGLFTGKYKVLSVNHKITPQGFDTDISMVQSKYMPEATENNTTSDDSNISKSEELVPTLTSFDKRTTPENQETGFKPRDNSGQY